MNPIKVEQSVRLPHTCAPERYAKHYLLTARCAFSRSVFM